jgi:hypothetical protein|tara:strand:- start:7 stop:132 length:126 start_codon:yes stop_codon:yes gene_type:complete
MIEYFEEEPLWVVLRAYDKMNRTAALGLHVSVVKQMEQMSI